MCRQMYRIRSGHTYAKLHKIMFGGSCETGVTKESFCGIICLNFYQNVYVNSVTIIN